MELSMIQAMTKNVGKWMDLNELVSDEPTDDHIATLWAIIDEYEGFEMKIYDMRVYGRFLLLQEEDSKEEDTPVSVRSGDHMNIVVRALQRHVTKLPPISLKEVVNSSTKRTLIHVLAEQGCTATINKLANHPDFLDALLEIDVRGKTPLDVARDQSTRKLLSIKTFEALEKEKQKVTNVLEETHNKLKEMEEIIKQTSLKITTTKNTMENCKYKWDYFIGGFATGLGTGIMVRIFVVIMS